MELIEKYIYAVTQRLPEKQRADIKKEIQGLIEDMLEERTQGGGATREEVESVLLELGEPHELAAKYRGYKRYLIGPDLFDAYWSTLKIVFIAIAISLCVVSSIEAIIEPQAILDHFVGLLVSIITVSSQGFAWVTLIFALMDNSRRKGETSDSGKRKAWKPADLPEVPDARSHIKLSDPITGIVFIVLFMVLCMYSIDLLGVYRSDGGERAVIPFFNADVFRQYLPIIWILAALGILKESVKIVMRKRTGTLVAFGVVVTIFSFIFLCIVFTDSSIWNPHFMQMLAEAGIVEASGKDYADIENIWTGATQGLIYLIALVSIMDIVTETYRWYRIKSS